MTIWLVRQALDVMLNEASSRHPLETGGVLLGWRAGEDKVVVDVLGPGPQALHGRYRFLPDHDWQIEQIHKRFASSNRDIDYLGDWHCHPDGVAVMSAEDQSTLRRISRRVPEPIMIILAGKFDVDGWSMGCWVGLRQRGLIRSCFELAESDVMLFDRPSNWPGQ